MMQKKREVKKGMSNELNNSRDLTNIEKKRIQESLTRRRSKLEM